MSGKGISGENMSVRDPPVSASLLLYCYARLGKKRVVELCKQRAAPLLLGPFSDDMQQPSAAVN